MTPPHRMATGSRAQQAARPRVTPTALDVLLWVIDHPDRARADIAAELTRDQNHDTVHTKVGRTLEALRELELVTCDAALHRPTYRATEMATRFLDLWGPPEDDP